MANTDYAQVLEDFREMAKIYTVVEISPIEINRDSEDGCLFFDVPDLSKEFYVAFGFAPKEMIAETIGEYDFSEVDKIGVWRLTFLLKYNTGDTSSYFEIVLCEAHYQHSIEQQREYEQTSIQTDLFGNQIPNP